MKMTFV